MVSKLMQDSLVRQIHERGHLGREKTEKLLKMDYWFKEARQKIESIIQNCINCILAEGKTGKREGWLHQIPKGERPFVTRHIDHLSPIDAFTKFVWLSYKINRHIEGN